MGVKIPAYGNKPASVFRVSDRKNNFITAMQFPSQEYIEQTYAIKFKIGDAGFITDFCYFSVYFADDVL